MLEVLKEAGIDTLKMLPVLAAMYVVIELIEHRYTERFLHWLGSSRRTAPVFGALLGSIPQCGFTVISAGLFKNGSISMGTLIAVFLATSDEAVPILAAFPGKAWTIVWILITKILIAVPSAYIIDGVISLYRKRKTAAAAIPDHAGGHDDGHDVGHDHEHDHDFDHTDIECASCIKTRNVPLGVFLHVIKTAAYVFGITFLAGLIIYWVGEEGLKRILLNNTVLQPIIMALVGLIPNCSASVAITGLYLKDLISFGSVIAGLSSAGGLGLIVLFRENRNMKQNFTIIGVLFGISAIVGIMIQIFS
jgi:uncharacterized membrane protein YraQ (UPF0718 family)